MSWGDIFSVSEGASIVRFYWTGSVLIAVAGFSSPGFSRISRPEIPRA